MTPIRNFVIISHVDHGKSTLADRFLELTETVEARKMHAQYLDRMPLEQEKGITIKMQPVRMAYRHKNSNDQSASRRTEYILNLIDTPGHVDFTYEVSRSLAAVEGAVLLVDATQGIQAQTLSNLGLARKEGFRVIPAVNKIDVANAAVEDTRYALARLLERDPAEISLISAKEGTGVPQLLERITREIPPPTGDRDRQLRALIFDSAFDAFKGIIAYVRIVDGSIKKGDSLVFYASRGTGEALELGYFTPELREVTELSAGEIGYIATGIKSAATVRVGDTITTPDAQAPLEPLPGYQEPKPMVYVSLFPEESDDFTELKDALEKLHLNDAALSYTAESSEAFGRGFRCGFLGMLHVEITQERLRREHNCALITSSPSVRYEVEMKSGAVRVIHSPVELPDPAGIHAIKEPWMKLEVVTPALYLGGVLQLLAEGRGHARDTAYLSNDRVLVTYEVPLAEIITDFYDRLKSVSSGYASMNYESLDYRPGDLAKLEILIAGEPVSAFARIVPRQSAPFEGRRIVKKLKEVLPRQNFAVALQAAVGGTIIARETISALRKDVTGYLYGGDVTRKKKLLEKQKRGKKRMMQMGKVRIPPHVILEMLKK